MKLLRSLLALAVLAAAPFASAQKAVRVNNTTNVLVEPEPADFWVANASDIASAISLSGYQPLDADLTSIAALATTSFGLGLLDDADATAGRASLGVVIGTNVQAWDADLDAYAAAANASARRDLLGATAGVFPRALVAASAISDVTGLQSALDLKAPLESPSFSNTVSVGGVSPGLVVGNATISQNEGNPTVNVLLPSVSGDLLTTTGNGSQLTNLNASNLASGTVAAARLPALTGDITTSAGSAATTLATVNNNVGSFGSGTQIPVFTVNGKGLITGASVTTVTPAWSSVTGKPTSVAGFGITDAVTMVPTDSGTSASINVLPSNQVGAGANTYTIFGGTVAFPNRIGDADLSFVTGYDNSVWDASIAAHLTCHHGIIGGNNGHATGCGGSRNGLFGGYVFAGSGLQNMLMADYASANAGRLNVVGAKGVSSLSVAALTGDTSITIGDQVGTAVAPGDVIYIGYPPDLNRATVSSVVGSVIGLSNFQHVTTTNSSGSGTGTGLVASVTLGIGTRVVWGSSGESAGGVGGKNILALGAFSGFAGGDGLMLTGPYTFGAGQGGHAAGSGSAVFGLDSYTLDASTIGLGAGRWSGGEPLGGAQSKWHARKVATTDATTTTLQIAAGLLPDSICFVEGQLVAREPATGDHKIWKIGVVAERAASGTVTVVGSPTITPVSEDAGAAAWSATLLGGTGTLNLRVTGEAGKTIRWVSSGWRTENGQ